MAPAGQEAGAAGGPSTGGAPETPPASGASAGTSPADAHAAAVGSADPFARRPEIFVGAAFAGGLVLAQILRRVGR
jgi:hypothetical protein